ncbi:hypothetical protein A2U01_0071434, partial [Trifolium medium]|nr:hypothetical protein [Trifolium medium]
DGCWEWLLFAYALVVVVVSPPRVLFGGASSCLVAAMGMMVHKQISTMKLNLTNLQTHNFPPPNQQQQPLNVIRLLRS